MRRSSRLTVDGLRPSCAAIVRTDLPAARDIAICCRSTNDRHPAHQATPTTRTDTAVGNHPPSALLAVRARSHRRIADELATLQLSPKHLHALRDHVISEPDGQHPYSVRCCNHRENPRFPLRTYVRSREMTGADVGRRNSCRRMRLSRLRRPPGERATGSMQPNGPNSTPRSMVTHPAEEGDMLDDPEGKSAQKRKRGQPTPRETLKVFQRDRYRCVACGANSITSPGIVIDAVRYEVDHVLPFSKEGPDELANFQTLCQRCNRGKGNDENLNRAIYNDLEQVLHSINPQILEELADHGRATVVADSDEFTEVARKVRILESYSALPNATNTFHGFGVGRGLGIYTLNDNGGPKLSLRFA